MDSIRIDPEGGIPEEMEFVVTRIDSRYEEYFKPNGPRELSSQLNKTVYHLIGSDTRCRAVDCGEYLFGDGVDGWKDEISSDDLLADLRI